MESRFIIFLALVSLTQCSVNLRVSYDLLEKDLPTLSKIIDNQQASKIEYCEGFGPVFDTLYKLAVELVFDRKPKTHKDSSKLAKGLARVKNAVDLSLDSVLLVQGKSCSAVEVARSKTHDILDDAFARIRIAVESAHSGNCHRNRSTIEVHRAAVCKDFTNLNEIVYSSISACLDITDADTVAVIKSAQEGSRIGLVNLVNAVFNAIKICAAAVAEKCADISLVSDIEDCRDKACIGSKNDVEHKFSALETLYINSRSDKKVAVSSLDIILFAQNAGANTFKEGNKVLFDSVATGLEEVDLGYCDAGKDDFSRNDTARAKQVAKFTAADFEFFDSMIKLHPEDSAAISQAQEGIAALEEFGGTAFFEAISTAGSKCENRSKTMATIEALRNATTSPAPDYTALVFSFIRNNQTLDKITEAKVQALQVQAAHGGGNTTDKFFDAVVILAEANCAGKVRDDDFCAIRKLLDVSNSGLDDYTQSVAAACFLVLKASDES